MTAHWTRRRFLGVGGGAVLAGLAIGACDGDEATPAATVPSTSSSSVPTGLPTNDERELTRLFDPLFDPVGQRVTRIGLYDLSEGFVRDDQGTHLAIYVEPLDPAGEGWDTTRYVENVVPGMAACTPFIFDTWPGIETMDVCQEPPQLQAPEPEPPIVTQVALGRADHDRIDWQAVELADLLAAAISSPETAQARGNDDVEDHPLWVAARADAAART